MSAGCWRIVDPQLLHLSTHGSPVSVAGFGHKLSVALGEAPGGDETRWDAEVVCLSAGTQIAANGVRKEACADFGEMHTITDLSTGDELESTAPVFSSMLAVDASNQTSDKNLWYDDIEAPVATVPESLRGTTFAVPNQPGWDGGLQLTCIGAAVCSVGVTLVGSDGAVTETDMTLGANDIATVAQPRNNYTATFVSSSDAVVVALGLAGCSGYSVASWDTAAMNSWYADRDVERQDCERLCHDQDSAWSRYCDCYVWSEAQCQLVATSGVWTRS